MMNGKATRINTLKKYAGMVPCWRRAKETKVGSSVDQRCRQLNKSSTNMITTLDGSRCGQRKDNKREVKAVVVSVVEMIIFRVIIIEGQPGCWY